MEEKQKFEYLKPFVEKTGNWRTKGFQKFWLSVLRYFCYGEVPSFVDCDGKDNYHLRDLFLELKAEVEKNISTTQKDCHEVPTTKTDDRNDEVYQKLLDALAQDSTLFTDVERCILIDMLKTSRNRNPRYYDTPFIYTTARVKKIGFEYNDFYILRDYLVNHKILSFEQKTAPGNNEYNKWPLSYYTLDEPTLLKMVLEKLAYEQTG